MNKGEMQLSIVVPAYNELNRAQALSLALESFSKKAPFSWELIIVDDGSKDNLEEALLRQRYFLELHSNDLATVLKHKSNRGKGAAIATGVAHSKGNYILTMDADLSTNPEEMIPWLLNMMQHAKTEIYIGSREHKDAVVDDLFSRRITGRIFNNLVRLCLPIKLKDTQCGFKLYPAPLAKEAFRNLHINGWAHDIEVILKLQNRQFLIIEQPVRWTVSNESKISVLIDSARMFKSVLYLWILNFSGKLK
jgi:dolichyl-phosphate beta-glucosyltransferase